MKVSIQFLLAGCLLQATDALNLRSAASGNEATAQGRESSPNSVESAPVVPSAVATEHVAQPLPIVSEPSPTGISVAQGSPPSSPPPPVPKPVAEADISYPSPSSKKESSKKEKVVTTMPKPHIIGKIIAALLFPAMMGDALVNHNIKTKFWGWVLTFTAGYMASVAANPLFLFPLLIITCSVVGNLFLATRPPARETMARGLESLFSHHVNGDFENPGWFKQAPHTTWATIVMLPSEKSHDGPVITEKVTRLLRGHLIELENVPVDTENIPKSLEDSYIAELTRAGKAVGEVLRPGSGESPPLVRQMDIWEFAREEDKTDAVQDLVWSAENRLKLNQFVRKNHQSKFYRTPATEENEHPFPTKSGLGIMIFPFMFCWWGFFFFLSLIALAYDSICVPGGICEIVLEAPLDFIANSILPRIVPQFLMQHGASKLINDAIGSLGAQGTGSAISILYNHLFMIIIWSLVMVVWLPGVMDNAGVDRRNHELGVKKLFAGLYDDFMGRLHSNKASGLDSQKDQASKQDTSVKDIVVPHERMNNEMVWPVVDVVQVNKDMLAHMSREQLDVPYEDLLTSQEDVELLFKDQGAEHDNVEKDGQGIITIRRAVRPPSVDGYNRIKLSPNGKILFAIWPHGFVCVNAVIGLHFSDTADTANAWMMVANALWHVPGANLFLWLCRFGMAGAREYKRQVTSTENGIIFPGGFSEAHYPEGFFHLLNDDKVGFLGSLMKLQVEDQKRKKGAGVLSKRAGVDYIIPICIANENSYYWNLLSLIADHNTLAKVGKLRVLPTAMPGPRLDEWGNVFTAVKAFAIPLNGLWISFLLASLFNYGLLSWWITFLSGIIPTAYGTHSYWKSLSRKDFKFARDIFRSFTMVPPQSATGTVVCNPPIALHKDEIPVKDYAEGREVRSKMVTKLFRQIKDGIKTEYAAWAPIHGCPPELKFAGYDSTWIQDDDGEWTVQEPQPEPVTQGDGEVSAPSEDTQIFSLVDKDAKAPGAAEASDDSRSDDEAAGSGPMGVKSCTEIIADLMTSESKQSGVFSGAVAQA